MFNQGNPINLQQAYLNKLRGLVQRFEHERRERFYPFYLIFNEEQRHPRFKEALSIGKYFLDHAFLNSEADELFFRALRQLIEKYRITEDYWDFAEKTPIPMQDYLKVLYDLNTPNIK